MTCHLTRTLLVMTVALAAVSPRVLAQPLETGRKAYEARCVGCHGSDGSGGGHGPGFVEIRRPRASSKPAMRDLIRGGIPGTAMPASTITDAELDALVDYVEVLRAPAADHPAAGDATAGERFFTGRGKCSNCHMVRGKGGILGPDLSDLARERRIAKSSRPFANRARPLAPRAATETKRRSRTKPSPCACATGARFGASPSTRVLSILACSISMEHFTP